MASLEEGNEQDLVRKISAVDPYIKKGLQKVLRKNESSKFKFYLTFTHSTYIFIELLVLTNLPWIYGVLLISAIHLHIGYIST